MRRSPEVLAWSVLLASFGMCVALGVFIPLAVRAFLTDSTDPAPRILQVQQGTLLLRRPTSPDFVGIVDQTTDVPDGSEIKADLSTQAVLRIREPGTDADLAIVQLYGNTALVVQAASSPRFDSSPNPHRLDLDIESGRIRVNILPDAGRPVAASLRAPQGEVTFSNGTYAVEVTNEELQVTVREGTATVSAQGAQVVVESLQRARVALGQAPQGGLSSERNLVSDGNFSGGAPPAWSIEHDLQIETEPKGTVEFRTFAGRRAAVFERTGFRLSHAETRLVQDISRDVRDAASLTLHFAVLISNQDVPVCGSSGSECPMMVRINYRDASGAEREWTQGFYSVPDPSNVNPLICIYCTTRNPHTRVTQNSWFTYDSSNLMDVLTVDDFKPARITRIVFYASGHAYQSAITDVELLVQD